MCNFCSFLQSITFLLSVTIYLLRYLERVKSHIDSGILPNSILDSVDQDKKSLVPCNSMILVFLPNWPFYVSKIWFMTQVFPLPFKLLWSPDISPTDGYFENNVELSFSISKGLQNDEKCQENERNFPDSVNVFFNLMQHCCYTVCPKRLVLFFATQWWALVKPWVPSSGALSLFPLYYYSILHVCLLSLAKTQELICRVFANFARPPKNPLSPLYGCMAREAQARH